MCGITGFANFNNQSPDRKIIQDMTNAIIHRGPDDGGTEVKQNVAFGNRRLAIIDLSKNGHMPMWSTDKNFLITYNGEIYNFLSLKKLLQQKGYKFFSNSDTEVILNLYQEFGQKSITMFKGMFVFAIFDCKKQELFLARDHFGIKPLHYFLNDKIFIFGSEIKSILLHPEIKREINPTAISHYFSLGFGCIASPETIFKNIKKLPPGHFAILKNKKLKIQNYWNLANIKQQKIDYKEAADKIKNLLENSVKEQLVSDVPLGCFLSGGIDSSLISTFTSQHTSHKLKTLSIGFEDKNFDESRYAEQVAKHLQTEHYHKSFKITELLQTLPKVIEKLDEPFADASILPTFLLSEFTKENVTVSLSGDGGDEIFAGYPTYIAHHFANIFNKFPSSLNNIFKNLAYLSSDFLKILPVASHAPSLSMKMKIDKFIDGLDKNPAKQYLNYMAPLNTDLKNSLIKNHKEKALIHTQNLLDKVKNWDKQSQLQYLDFYLYMIEDCLVKTDRASSFNSLEVRPPFLDKDLVEFAFSLPANYKFDPVNLTLKKILKTATKDLLPQNIIDRPKKGFGIPTHLWLKNELNQTLKDLNSKERIEKQGLFNYQFIKDKIEEHGNNKYDHRLFLWSLLIFQLWWDKWMK
ncbi:asparagine synthase (glutamine-hydrolyzing) [Candidatus Beckwithbacteria bacterium]|nr:asparagine synthase (glutamine-hydrolyzing) [Candidatus Beckwithbacteria bacterium]